jgi:transcriptional regulator with XRE-family HTH domain
MGRNAKKLADAATADVVLRAIGRRIRHKRAAQGLTLAEVAEKTGLSVSMLSLVERGKASASVGTLVAIGSTLDLRVAELIGGREQESKIVTPFGDQSVLKALRGVVHRVVADDQIRGLQITFNQYGRGTANSPKPITHEGFEYGLILDGNLEVTVDGTRHSLSVGDLISYRSTRPHRIVNRGKKRARAIWINLRTET